MREDFSRKAAKAQSAIAFLRIFFAALRLCVRNLLVYRLKRRQIVFAVGAFDGGLTGSVVARRGDGFKAALVDWLTATRTDSVASFLHPEQRLIDIGNDLRAAFAKSQCNLFVQILNRQINTVLNSVVVKLECGGLIGANLFSVLA